MSDAPVIEQQPTGLDGWMKSLGTIEEVFEPPAAPAPAPAETPPKDEKPDASKTASGPAGGNPPADDKTPAPAAAPAATPDAGPKPADAGAAPGAKPAEAAKPEEGEEQWPRTNPDWEKFKAKRKEREEALKKDISTREATIAELQAAKKELEDKIAASTTTEKNPDMERLEKENQALTERIMALDVTQDPRFTAYFENKTNAQFELAKRVVGPDKADELVKALKMPDTEELREIKEATIEEIMGGLSPIQQSRIGAVLNNLEGIKSERESEIAKAAGVKDRLKGQTEERNKAILANRNKVFGEVLSKLQDPKDGVPFYREIAGNDAWNKGVKERITIARKLLDGDGVTPQEVVNSAFAAVAYPQLMAVYADTVKAKDAEIYKLQEQVKTLSAAQPNKGTSGEGANGAEPPGLTLKPGMSPSEATAAFAKSIAGGWSQ